MDNELVIEKNVPLPGPCERVGPILMAVRKMNVGDSFIFVRQIQFNLSYYAKATGFKFTSRKIDSEKVRVWRVA